MGKIKNSFFESNDSSSLSISINTNQFGKPGLLVANNGENHVSDSLNENFNSNGFKINKNFLDTLGGEIIYTIQGSTGDPGYLP